ncbi:MAG: hypothetical protein ISR64_08050 [Deltaproteobacteria bacterium]|nr:hypothetical protein [Deltaproteobacteria bacterium]
MRRESYIVRSLIVLFAALVTGCGGGDTADPQDPGGPLDPGFSAEDVIGDPGMDPMPSEVTDPGEDQGTDQGADPGTDQYDPGPADEGPKCEEGDLCDDGDPCTHTDRCKGGACVGTAYACDDGRACTDDLCDGYGGCGYPVSEGLCLINNVCFEPGQASALSACVICDPAVSDTAFALAEDGTTCGKDDPCLSEGQCQSGQCTGAATGCDDDDPCTDDQCVPGQGCANPYNFDPCNDGDPCTLGDQCIEGACVTGFLPLDCDDSNPCTDDLCTGDGCLNDPVSLDCDDGDLCTHGDLCEAGACIPGEPANCNDGNDCTEDYCDPALGCVHDILDNPCCLGVVHICNDKNPCTEDLCDIDTGECLNPVIEGSCDDGDACTGPDECTPQAECVGPELDCDDGNACTADSCVPVVGCQHLPEPGGCDDGNACTENDQCAGGLCKGALVVCDDGDPCTTDSCDADGGCVFEPYFGPCNDGNACTLDDNCATGICQGTAKDCDDGNQCTADSCHPAAGCQNLPVAGGCDDGDECTVDDQCVNGTCLGTPEGLCCTPEFTAPVNKINMLAMGDGGLPGHALDVDGLPTCSPADNCQDGLDNSLGLLSVLANDPIQEAMDKGEIIVLFEHRGFNTLGDEYFLGFFQGDPDAPGCDVQTQSCAYWVGDEMMGTDCEPLYGFPNATITGDHLVAGGVGFTYPFDIPITDGVILSVLLANAQMDATVTLSGGLPVAMDGVLAGAVPKSNMIEAVNAIPADQLPEGMSKDLILQMLSVLVVNDIDTDGDGNLNAASVGIRFQAIGGTIIGVD